MNTNTTFSTGFDKLFYDKCLLKQATTQLVYSKHGQKRTIPKKQGKKVEMRRWCSWDPSLAIKPLTEGEPPDGLTLEQEPVEVDIQQYGAYFTYSDMLDMTSYYDLIDPGVGQLGELLGTVVEWVTRDELTGGNHVSWAGGATGRSAITAESKLTIADIRKAARELKRRKTPLFERGDASNRRHLIAIVSPETAYDLQSDPMWQAANTYVNNEAMYTGELGMLFGVVFLESTEAPVVRNSLDTTVAAYDAARKVVTLATPISEAARDYLDEDGAQVVIGGEIIGVSGIDAATHTVTLAAAPVQAPATGIRILSRDGADSGIPVHQTLLFGRDAYGILHLDESKIQSILKPAGNGGFDPLNQRGTVGAKVAYAAKILNEDWIMRIEHAATEDAG